MSEITNAQNIRLFVSEWEKTNAEGRVQLVNQTIQKKDPVLNATIEVCRLLDFAKTYDLALDGERRRLCFLMLVTVSRLYILGSALGHAFKGTSEAAQLRLQLQSLVPWDTLHRASQSLTTEQIEDEYYQWTLRTVQKKQNPVSAQSLKDALQFIRDSVTSGK